LGYVRKSLDRPAEAQGLFLAALEGFQEVGDQHGAANAIASLGVLELGHGDDANAAQLLEQALAVLTALEDHPAVARTMSNLAIIEAQRGRAQEAIGHWTRTVSSTWKWAAPNPPVTSADVWRTSKAVPVAEEPEAAVARRLLT
jgi:tetratricopeptide (TPR) repeat protein